MKISDLIKKGYFPKELPPPFNTYAFSDKVGIITRQWREFKVRESAKKPGEGSNEAKRRFKDGVYHVYKSSKPVSYSIHKGNMSRRDIDIPNPFHFLNLARNICNVYPHIKKTFDLSSISESRPVIEGASRSVRTVSKSRSHFNYAKLHKGFRYRYEVRFDIVQFYPSIYTHTIPWAILGKELAKKYLKLSKRLNNQDWSDHKKGDPVAEVYSKFDYLDTQFRECQEDQSIGLPIGPDTSFVIAEAIASRIDKEIIDALEGIDCCGLRYYDDYIFYANSYDDAEKILKIAQLVFSKYKLKSNEKKAKIIEQPFAYGSQWASSLISFNFITASAYSIYNYFGLVFDSCKKYQEERGAIVLFSLRRFTLGFSIIPNKYVWDVFEKFLLQAIQVAPEHLPIALELFLAYKDFLNEENKAEIQSVLNELIQRHQYLGHSMETSWCLWICKSLEIKVRSSHLKFILGSDDVISKLLALDILSNNLHAGRKPGLTDLKKELSAVDFFNDSWLLIYEAFIQGWIIPRSRTARDQNEFMNILRRQNVSFYNTDLQLDVTPLLTKRKKIEELKVEKRKMNPDDLKKLIKKEQQQLKDSLQKEVTKLKFNTGLSRAI